MFPTSHFLGYHPKQFDSNFHLLSCVYRKSPLSSPDILKISLRDASKGRGRKFLAFPIRQQPADELEIESRHLIRQQLADE